MSKHQILSIEAWRDGDGWTWNQWHERGTVTGDQLGAVTDGGKLNARKFLAMLRDEGFNLPAGKVAVEDDGYNYVAVQKNTREPLYAVCYGDEIGENLSIAGRGTLSVGGVELGTVTGLTVEPVDNLTAMQGHDADMPDHLTADQAQVIGAAMFRNSTFGKLGTVRAACPIQQHQIVAACDADTVAPATALHWPAHIPLSADTLRDQLTRGKARIVGSQRARVLRKRGEAVRYAYDTKTGKRRFLWCMGGDKGQA